MVRVLSGGGTLTGVDFVLGTEPAVLVALLLGSLLVGVLAILGLALDRSWAWDVSNAGAAVALATSVLLGLDGHDSANVAVIAALVVLAIGLLGRVRKAA
jgi:urea transporter